MASRTESAAVKVLATSGAVRWRLEFNPAWELFVEPLPLQKWRVVGDGRTVREQIREYATIFQRSHSEEGENTLVPSSPPSRESAPSSGLTPMVEGGSWEDRGQSPDTTRSVVQEAETMLLHSPPRGASLSSGSEFNYADGYVSGEEEIASKGDKVDDESIEPPVKDAYSFQIFQLDDEEERKPASILDLYFDCNEGHSPSARLHLVGYGSSDSSGLFMRTIDSWSMKQDEELRLKICVQDTKGSWIKLWNPSKGYEKSVREVLVIANFLELAMKSKETKAKRFLDQLVEKIGLRRAEIKKILRKYYNSVVMKFVQGHKGSSLLRKAPILKTMQSLLKGDFQKDKNVVTLKRPASSDKLKQENVTLTTQPPLNKRRRIVEMDQENVSDEDGQKGKKISAHAVRASNKRKRVVESEPEIETDSEDHIPLSQRNFLFSEKSFQSESVPEDGQFENTVNMGEPDIDCGRKQDQGNCGSADVSLSPPYNQDDSSPRWSEEDIVYGGDEDLRDIADIYGIQIDEFGEIGDDDNEDLGESAFCAICDDGGDLLFCDGPCMRSFHASKESAANSSESQCRSLGYTVEEVQEMGSWLCQNCVCSEHQCFICGQLGRSEGEDKEVFLCDVALCGRFYHPLCLAKWKNEERFNRITDLNAFIQSVKEGVEEFCCPAHKCRTCGEGEEEGGADNSMKLAKCRRCPKAYHKVCLPKRISFESRGHDPIRAWEIGDEDDPVKRLVIYCLDHVIIEELSTPRRNHLKWPKDSLLRQNIAHKEGLDVIELSPPPLWKQQKVSKSSSLEKRGACEDAAGSIQPCSPILEKMPNVPLRQKIVQEDVSIRKPYPLGKLGFGSAITARQDGRVFSVPKREPTVVASIPTPVKYVNPPTRKELNKKSMDVCTVVKNIPFPKEGQNDRVSQIMHRASRNVTLETVKQNLVQPSCYGENRKKNFIHRGELVSIINAAKKALEIVKNGGSIEDAKRLCPRDLFLQMLKSVESLKVYLAPFLHGGRYTSFGRHFTCVDKLKEIVDRIHPYIDNGDMVVDFSCGANDFSILLNEKLLSTGKTCHFMNFDIHPAKNGFCFTKGDWLQNEGHGFFEGKKLIMGLNPPFGVNAALANKFIVHALTFRPKLLVLIVPPQTMSSSSAYEKYNYQLVWEDKELLKGHAFYLPGSVDNNDNENKTQWNVVPPPLYLWSSGDMIRKHKEIALRCKHIEILQADAQAPNKRTPTQSPPALELSRLKASSDKRANSGSTPTECDTSSSRLQLSSATSSLADGLSQNSLDGPGTCHSAGDHNPSVLKSTHSGQGSREASPGWNAQREMSFNRKGFGPGSAGYNIRPVAGVPQNIHIPGFPYQHLKSSSRHSNLEGIPTPNVKLSHTGPPYSDSHGNVTSSAFEVHANRVNSNLNQSIPAGQAQQGRVNHQSLRQHDDNTARRTTLDLGDGARPITNIADQKILKPLWYRNTHPDQQQTPFFQSRGAQVVFPHKNPNISRGIPQQLGPPQMWQQPSFHSGQNMGYHRLPGFPLQPEGLQPVPPRHGVYMRGLPPQFERRPGGSQHGMDFRTGGWLD